MLEIRNLTEITTFAQSLAKHQEYTFTSTVLLKYLVQKNRLQNLFGSQLSGCVNAKAEHKNNNELYASSSIPIILIPAPLSCVWGAVSRAYRQDV